MGLDMYLKYRYYPKALVVKEDGSKDYPIGGDFELATGEEKTKLINIPVPDLNLGYWRKSSHIHRWFVKKCGAGIDDCHPMLVSRNNLIELKNICEKILANKELAKDLLPMERGYFFNIYRIDDYGESYFCSLEDTIKIINEALEITKYISGLFYYRASW